MKKVLFSILFFLILLEIGLRMIGRYDVYTEQLGRKYSSNWGLVHEGHYKLMKSNVIVTNDQTEFTTQYATNSFGMRNPEIEQFPKDSVTRILCFGDSFTEGDGATNGFSYPRQLEKILNAAQNGHPYEVINIGINGSDIIYIEKLFTELAFSLKPKNVLIAINITDVGDLIQRGGYERFLEDNTTQYKDGPWFEKYYAKSHVVRLVAHVIFRRTPLLLSRKGERKAGEEAVILIEQSMIRIKNFGTEKGIDIRFILHPTPGSDMIYNEKEEIASELNVEQYINALKTDPSGHPNGEIYDLNPIMVDTLRQLEYRTYAWPINGHFNDNGYKIMAEEIYQFMLADSLI